MAAILYATRAIESPPREGGFVLLSDLAQKTKDEKDIEAFFFSSGSQVDSINTEQVFSKPGWNAKLRMEFLYGLFKTAHKYELVHTAHIPTKINTFLIKIATRRARKSGTKFIQTVTGLPDINVSAEALNGLLWGDHIVCQSKSIYDKVKSTRDSVSLITPWPATSRVAYSADRKRKTRQKLFPDFKNVIVFPGEFDRLGIDDSFSECIEELLKETENTVVVLACRFDKLGTGSKLAAKFPKNVLSVGSTKNILRLIEASDLTIYPVKKMDSKFQPPLVIIESLQLGTKTLVSDLIEVSEASDLLEYHSSSSSWTEIGNIMAKLINKGKQKNKDAHSDNYKKMTSAYIKIYKTLLGGN